jgi:uncharacterized tellurite resistance protein B-like protein
MRSLLRLIGLDPSGAADSRDTETVRRIAGELDKLPEEEARYLAAFAYVLVRVAHADWEISEAELREMERLVQACGDLSRAQAALVVQIAKSQTVALGATENYLVTRQFRELASKEQRLALLRCLFAVAAADDRISQVENAHISQIAGELGLTSTEVAAARSEFRDKLAVLKDLPTSS